MDTVDTKRRMPSLSLPERIEYMRKYGFIDLSPVSDEAELALSRVVFHFLMGYARNYKKRFGAGTLEDIIEIYTLDQQVSVKVFEGIQQVERRLRLCYVESYVEHFSPYEVYLEDDSYRRLVLGAPSVATQIRRQILQSSESYIQRKSDPVCEKWGTTRKELARSGSEQRQIEALRELPIWATIDWWSFGTLAKAISSFRGHSTAEDAEVFLWKEIADDVGIARRIFIGQLEGVTVLRNLVGHHNRLWMRPSVSTPKVPKIYARESRNTHDKAMYVPLLTLASFLEGMGHGREFKNEVDELLSANPRYAEGLRQIGGI